MSLRRRGEVKRPAVLWLNNQQIRSLNIELDKISNLEYLLAYQFLLITGRKFNMFKQIKWGDYNALNRSVLLPDKKIKVSVNMIKVLDYLRLQARSESQQIIKITYTSFWRGLTRCYFKIGIDDARLGVKLLRNTYAFRHWNFYQNKARLKFDMGIKNMRFLPPEIFEYKQLNLFDDCI